MIGVAGDPTSEGLILKPVADLPADKSALNAPPPRPYISADPGDEPDEGWEKLDRHGDYRALRRALDAMKGENGNPVLYWVLDTMFLNPSRVIGSGDWRDAFEVQMGAIRDATFWLAGWMLPRLGRRIRVPVVARRVEIFEARDDELLEVALRYPSKREFARAAGIRNHRRAGRLWTRARESRKPER